jgi:hypothetical protein
MSTQTIAEYLDEERKKYAANQLRMEEEAARVRALQHGQRRNVKQPKIALVALLKTVSKKKKQTDAVARNKPRALGKMAAKARKRA